MRIEAVMVKKSGYTSHVYIRLAILFSNYNKKSTFLPCYLPCFTLFYIIQNMSTFYNCDALMASNTSLICTCPVSGCGKEFRAKMQSQAIKAHIERAAALELHINWAAFPSSILTEPYAE